MFNSMSNEKKPKTYLFLFSRTQLSIWINNFGGSTLCLLNSNRVARMVKMVRLQSCDH